MYARSDQILISVSKIVDIVDKWTEGTSLLLGNIRTLAVCQKLRTLWTTGRRGQIYN